MSELVLKTTIVVKCPTCGRIYTYVFKGPEKPDDLESILLAKGWIAGEVNRFEFCPNPECKNKCKVT